MALRFKLDENLPEAVRKLLVEQGHDTLTVLDQQLGGQSDERISAACVEEDRILVTFDLDFSDIRQYPPESHRGLWILRPASQSVVNTVSLVRSALPLTATEPTQRALWIVEPGRVRIRTAQDQ
jgi:predicted nuclease of predicted toxin-antitoxin system